MFSLLAFPQKTVSKQQSEGSDLQFDFEEVKWEIEFC